MRKSLKMMVARDGVEPPTHLFRAALYQASAFRFSRNLGKSQSYKAIFNVRCRKRQDSKHTSCGTDGYASNTPLLPEFGP